MRNTDVFGKRLKEIRLRRSLSQKTLGILAGIDEFSASTRVNRYELSIHQPDYRTAQRLAKALSVPTPYLFADDDVIAEVIHHVGQLSGAARTSLLTHLREMNFEAETCHFTAD